MAYLKKLLQTTAHFFHPRYLPNFSDICHQPILPKWPRANGLVENFNKPFLRCIVTAHIEQTNWRQALYSFLLNYRATPHCTTGIAPGEMLFGRQMRTKLPHVAVAVDQKDIGKIAEQNDARHKNKNKVYSDRKDKMKGV